MIRYHKFEVDRERYPFQPNWVNLSNNACVHYVDEGKGPVILLLHGNPTWSFLYRNIIPKLAKNFRVIAPDYPGFGFSLAPKGFNFTAQEQAAAIAEFVDKLELENVTIMGQDWGGPIGFALAQQNSSRVSAFIISNTWAWPLERLGQKIFSAIMGGMIGRLLARYFNGIVMFFMTQGVVTQLDPKIMKMYQAPFHDQRSRKPTQIFPRELRSASPFLSKIYKAMPSIADKPVLILWGQKDFAFQEPERERFEQIFPNHKTVLLANAGHFVQEDAPEKIAKEIIAWLAPKKLKTKVKATTNTDEVI